MRSAIVAVLLLSTSAAGAARAQSPDPSRHGKWAFGLSIGTSAFSGAARSTDPDGADLIFAPYRPTMWGLHAGYGRERLRVELSARYGAPGLGFRGAPVVQDGSAQQVLLVAEDAYHVGELSLGLSTRLLRLRSGPTFRMSGAMVLERWTAPGTAVRSIAGGEGGLEMEVLLTGTVALRAQGKLGFTPGSPFRQGDLPEGFVQRSTWRRSLGVGFWVRP